MALNVSAWSIRQPLPPLIIAATFIALGLQSFFKLRSININKVNFKVILCKYMRNAITHCSGSNYCNRLIHGLNV